jgi:hypothetical protein
MSFPQRPEDNHNHLESHLGGSGSGGKQTSSARKRSNGGSGGGVTQSAKDAPPKAAGSARKRARGSSVSKPQNVTPPSPPGTSDHYNGNGNGNGDGNDNRNDNRNGHLKSAESPAPPAVLIREKKQKACANCRRAKLKCIVDDGETDCIRCKARKEKCVFYPRGHVSWLNLIVCHYHAYLDFHHVNRMRINRMKAKGRARERTKERRTELMRLPRTRTGSRP